MNTQNKCIPGFLAYLSLFLALFVSCSSNPSQAQFPATNASPDATNITSSSISCKKDGLSEGEESNAIVVTIDPSCQIGESHFTTGITQTDNSLLSSWGSNNIEAVNQAKALIKSTIAFQNTHIMGWGLPDPWPNPSDPEPTNWSLLDQRLQVMVETGSTPVLTLCEAPWWMKGKNVGRKPAQTLTAADEWSTTAYESRILDNKMGSWLHLVQRIAERYMVPPYNVRYFQVWNEMKGYYDPAINNFDYTTSPGNPNGSYANHGYTYMYNQVYNTLLQVAKEDGIDPKTINIGGPYIFMDTWSTPKHASHPSQFSKVYGTIDQRSLDVIQYWLQHKDGAGFITIDGSVENRDTGLLATDPFTAGGVFADLVTWIRSLDPTLYPGSTTLPIWMAEWFAAPRQYLSGGPADAAFDNAVKASTMMKFIKASGSVALSWGASGDGSTDLGLWTTTSYPDGGQAHPWFYTLKSLKKDFGAGEKLYDTNIMGSSGVEALATQSHVLLVNKTTTTLVVWINSSIKISLAPHDVKVVPFEGK